MGTLYKFLSLVSYDHTHHLYALVGRARRLMVVVVFVRLSVCVCVILQRTFLRDSNELSNEICNATTAQHSTTTK